ncbi:MAG: 16S rRNA (guanine(527)-N(7))-methyltransferase RsmG [Desulfobacterales bacterium]
MSEPQYRQIWAYHRLLREHNAELNLTRIHNFANMVLKLYVDSVLPALRTPLPSPLLDLGTGPGLPGIPLKIFRPDLVVLLAETRGKRVAFLEKAVRTLGLSGIEVIGGRVTSDFERPVAGVITRAVESIPATLERIRGCLVSRGRIIFMKGPNCDEEIHEAVVHSSEAYTLVSDDPYRIPHSPHERRLVIFERRSEPPFETRARAEARHPVRSIESEQNPLYKNLKKLHSARGIKKQGKALVSGARQAIDTLARYPDRCEAWISGSDNAPPPPGSPDHLAWIRLEARMFRELDIFGTGSPLLLARIPAIDDWDPDLGFPTGCSVLVAFQDPENVGAVVRSSVAFGASQIILLAECAHPFLPKAIRASGGAAFSARFLQGPSIQRLPSHLPVYALSADGIDIDEVTFPSAFGLLPGIEGPGLPAAWRTRAVAIPIHPEVESLNAAVATGIALYVWSRSRTEHNPCRKADNGPPAP